MEKQALQELFKIYVELRNVDPRGIETIRLRNDIVVANMPLAREIAHRMKETCPEPYEDLEQWAAIGLIKAVEKYDPDRKAAFSSFAVPYIQGEIQHFLRDDFGGGPKVPRREIELSSRAIRVSRICGIEMDETIVARGLKVSAQKLRKSLEARTRKPVKSLDHEVLHPPTEDAPIEQDYSWIKKHLASLPEPLQSVVIDRYLRNLSETKIARARKVPVAQVQAWLRMGLMKLKEKSPHADASN